jgi:tetratricopeptide (TPR) repeat protein
MRISCQQVHPKFASASALFILRLAQFGMSKTFLSFLAAACLFWGATSLADDTNSASSISTSNTDVVNSYIQIQAQLHQTQMIEDSNREQVIAELQQNASDLDTRLQLLEHKMEAQRASEADSALKVERTMLLVAGIGMLALAAVVIMVFLQLRTATRLIELTMAPAPSNGARALPVVETAAALPASARAALEFSNARLLGVIERLEKRILELEETVRLPLNGNSNYSSEPERDTPSDRRVEDLIVEGQLYLDTNKTDKALQCFNTALDIQPDNPDALIKKAAALEKLGQIEKAITCYDRAIDLGDSSTTALLQKGGMLNRLARYDEALQCYERALQTQEKKAMSS